MAFTKSALTSRAKARVLSVQLGGGVDETEMFRVFNMGIGMMAVAPPAAVDGLRQAAEEEGVPTWVIGEVVNGEGVTYG